MVGDFRGTVADAIVRRLVELGVRTVYGVVSIHNLPLYDALSRDGRISVVAARSEGAAVNMADAHARVTGMLGVAITSTGTGAGNAIGALMEAWSAGTPLLHITGQVPVPFIGTGRGYIHECRDQLEVLTGSCKAAYSVRRPEQIHGLLERILWESMMAPAGPVSLEIPIDIQGAEVDTVSTVYRGEGVPASPPKKDLEDIAEKLFRARRIVIWAGTGAVGAGEKGYIRRLAECLGAAVVTSQGGRGVVPEDHPLCIGNFANFEAVGRFVESADILLSVGVRFRSNETAGWRFGVPREHIGIDADLSAVDRNYKHSAVLIGDAANIVGSLLEILENKRGKVKDEGFIAEIEAVRRKVRQELRDQLGPYERIMDSLRAALPRNAVLVRDVTVPATSWGSRLFEIYEPRTSIHASGGGIGQGLPMAVGAKKGKPDQVVALMVGDGGFLVNVGELATLVQERLAVLIILFDDSGYGVLRNIQDSRYGRRIGVDLLSPDLVQLGESFGIPSCRVGSTQEFEEKLREALPDVQLGRRARLIVVDMEAVGPMKKPFGGPPGS